MPRKKKPTYPIDRMGKTCGFTEHEDGSLEIASMYEDRFDDLAVDSAAVAALLKSCIQQCNQLQVNIEKRAKALWDAIAKDYGIDYTSRKWSFNHHTRRLRPEAVAEDSE